MEVSSLTDFRKNMKAYFDKILQQGKPLFISRPKGEDVVIMSKAGYNSMQETFHLLRSPKNAERLLQAMEQDKKGGGTVQELSDL